MSESFEFSLILKRPVLSSLRFVQCRRRVLHQRGEKARLDQSDCEELLAVWNELKCEHIDRANIGRVPPSPESWWYTLLRARVVQREKIDGKVSSDVRINRHESNVTDLRPGSGLGPTACRAAGRFWCLSKASLCRRAVVQLGYTARHDAGSNFELPCQMLLLKKSRASAVITSETAAVCGQGNGCLSNTVRKSENDMCTYTQFSPCFVHRFKASHPGFLPPWTHLCGRLDLSPSSSPAPTCREVGLSRNVGRVQSSAFLLPAKPTVVGAAIMIS